MSSPLPRSLTSVLGPYAHEPEEYWPVLPLAQLHALHETASRRVAAIWHDDEEFPRLGRKPWFAMTGGILPTTLRSIWLMGLIRLDKGSGVYKLEAENLSVGRARLTPLGRRVMEMER